VERATDKTAVINDCFRLPVIREQTWGCYVINVSIVLIFFTHLLFLLAVCKTVLRHNLDTIRFHEVKEKDFGL